MTDTENWKTVCRVGLSVHRAQMVFGDDSDRRLTIYLMKTVQTKNGESTLEEGSVPKNPC